MASLSNKRKRSCRKQNPPPANDGGLPDSPPPASRVKVTPPLASVVKVLCTHSRPNYSLPWQRKRQTIASCSGFVIEGKRIITNINGINNHARLKLKMKGKIYKATLLAIGHDCNLALLTVNNRKFWEGVSPVKFGGLPALGDPVRIAGYPIGVDTVSVTSGIVSRIDMVSYDHGSTELLGLQIDAAANSEHSGGPAFSDRGECVGIAFKYIRLNDAKIISHVIPATVILHFIKDYDKNGMYTGFPVLGFEWQDMENPDLRRFKGMRPEQKGVLIKRIEPTAPGAQFLKPSDVILSLDGVDIANDGTVPFRGGGRIDFSYLVSQKYTGTEARYKVLRDSQTLEFVIKVGTRIDLIPEHYKGKLPSYYIVGGLVFTAVYVPYLRSEYKQDYEHVAPAKLLDKYLYGMVESVDEQVVVLSQVLAADVNIGYEEMVNTQVVAFNGKPVKNLKDLANMVENCCETYLEFDLDDDQIVVLETNKAKAATSDILATHRIPSAMSDDLKA